EVMTQWRHALEFWKDGGGGSWPVGLQWLLAGVVLIALSLSEALHTAAGFGLYVNSRTLIEGWDIELSLKRLRDRLSKTGATAAALVLLLAMGAGGGTANARD